MQRAQQSASAIEFLDLPDRLSSVVEEGQPSSRYFEPSERTYSAELPEGHVRWAYERPLARVGKAATILDCSLPVEVPAFRWFGTEMGDISWWVGIMYFLGAICWITNAAASGWPLRNATVNLWLLGATSITGGSLFHIGAMCQYWEALNTDRKVLFGYHIDEARGLLVASLRRRHYCCCGGPTVYRMAPSSPRSSSTPGGSSKPLGRPSTLYHTQSSKQRRRSQGSVDGSLLALQQPGDAPPVAAAKRPPSPEGPAGQGLRQQHSGGPHAAKDVSMSAGSSWSEWTIKQSPEGWVWFGFRWRDLGFVAALMQGTGTTIFLFACICGFPYVLPTNFEEGDWVLWDALYWAPFLLGSCLFISSAAAFTIEVQPNWYTPAPGKLTWWLNVCNLAGSIGFWLCSFFGFFAYPAGRYQKWGMAFSCLWGSCFFLVAAYLQILDALNKYERPYNATAVGGLDAPAAGASVSLRGGAGGATAAGKQPGAGPQRAALSV